MARAIRIELDGKEVCRLLPGQSRELQGNGKAQVMTARLDWTSSPGVSLTDRPDSEVLVRVALPPFLQALYRSFFRPRSALILTVDHEGSKDSTDGRTG
jgi:hypothetical protein